MIYGKYISVTYKIDHYSHTTIRKNGNMYFSVVYKHVCCQNINTHVHGNYIWPRTTLVHQSLSSSLWFNKNSLQIPSYNNKPFCSKLLLRFFFISVNIRICLHYLIIEKCIFVSDQLFNDISRYMLKYYSYCACGI